MTDRPSPYFTPRALADFTRVVNQTGILDPNDAYTVAPVEPEPHGPPETWWSVTRYGRPCCTCPTREAAERFATDPAYRAARRAAEIPLHLRGQTG